MKTTQEVLAAVTTRLRTTWAAHLAGEPAGHGYGPDGLSTAAACDDDGAAEAASANGAEVSAWPATFALGVPSGARLGGDFAMVREQAQGWRDWVRDKPARLRTTTRQVAGTSQQFPTHLEVATIDDAAALAGPEWVDRLATGRRRAASIAAQFPHAAGDLRRRLSRVCDLSEVDFTLLCAAGSWFATHDAAGLTPRQVPIEGLHAKWLNHRHDLVAWLAGLPGPDLGLAPPHPARIHFTYLDPAHLAAGGRRHDSATVGDTDVVAYRPRVVLISENKDTAVGFPPVPGGIAIEGEGFGGKTAAAFDWIAAAPVLLYWGDLDVYGFEILDGFRADGVRVESLLMDQTTYATYARYGTDLDARGRPLVEHKSRDTPHLTSAERALYERLAGPRPGGPRRIEQERISLTVAAEAVLARA